MKILILILLISAAAFAQDHAPTAERCKADQAVWGSSSAHVEYFEAETQHVRSGISNRTDIALLSIPQLKERMSEMYQCEEVVTTEPFHSAVIFYHDVIGDRYISFVKRHDLTKQMMAEDAAGKR
jgi:hypothetical protein